MPRVIRGEEKLLTVWEDENEMLESCHSPYEKIGGVCYGIHIVKHHPISYRMWCEKERVALLDKGIETVIKERERYRKHKCIKEIALERV